MDPTTLLVTALALAAFGTGGDVTPATTNSTLEEPLVLTVSAAEIGGPGERIAISPDGGAWIQDGDGPRLSFSLEPGELDSVAEAADLAFANGSRTLPWRCLDCPVYRVRLGPERLDFDATGRGRSAVLAHLVETIEGTVPEGLTR